MQKNRKPYLVFYLLFLLLPFTMNKAQSAPRVDVWEHIDFEVGPLQRIQGKIQVKGRAVQRSTGKGASNLPIQITIDGKELLLVTTEQGEFQTRIVVNEGTHNLSVDYFGDKHLTAAHYEVSNLNIQKNPLTLSIEGLSSIPDSDISTTFTVTIHSETPVGSLPISVHFLQDKETYIELPPLTGNQDLPLSISLSQKILGNWGPKKLVVQFAGNSDFDEAQASHHFTLLQSSVLTLSVDKSEYMIGDTISVKGRVVDGRGQAISSALIRIESKGKNIADVQSDQRGDFSLKIDADELGVGKFNLQAIYNTSLIQREQTRSPPLVLSVKKGKPLSLFYTISAFAFTGFSLFSFIVLRTKPWKSWTFTRVIKKTSTTKKTPSNEALPKTGFIPSSKKTVDKEQHYDFNGKVVEIGKNQPISKAIIASSSQTALEVFTNRNGTFCFGSLESGQYEMSVTAYGYIKEHFQVHIPHRGECHNCIIKLLPVREKIFSLYKEVVTSKLPSPELWGIWTPREILDHIRRNTSSDCLSALTNFVEESFFSQRTPAESKIVHLLELISAVEKETGMKNLQIKAPN